MSEEQRCRDLAQALAADIHAPPGVVPKLMLALLDARKEVHRAVRKQYLAVQVERDRYAARVKLLEARLESIAKIARAEQAPPASASACVLADCECDDCKWWNR